MLILASSSPRRQELLRQIGVPFSLSPVDIDEFIQPDETPQQYVQRLAQEKAQAASQQHPSATILGSDTCVVYQQSILGKPVNNDHAAEMLKQLSGHRHQVITAVALLNAQHQRVINVTTEVVFRSLSDNEIQAYIDTGEPADKAGGYGIQGLGAILVNRIEGSYSNVVGLPLTETAQLLQQFHIPIWQTSQSRTNT